MPTSTATSASTPAPWRFYEQALAIQREALPADHPDIAMSLNNLASVHRDFGEHARALALHEEALMTLRRVLPPDHPDIAASLNNLANVHSDRGEYARALARAEEGLTISRKALPADHLDIAPWRFTRRRWRSGASLPDY